MADKLINGVVGSKLVAFFKETEGLTPIDALPLEVTGPDSLNYRITFDDERVSDWKVTFDGPSSSDVIDIEKYNDVI